MGLCVTWLIHMWDMTHSCVWHDTCECVTWFIHMCDVTHSYLWHDSFICVTWLIHMCDMTHSYVWRETFMCVTWLIHMLGMTHSYVLRDSFICVTWLYHMCDRERQRISHWNWKLRFVPRKLRFPPEYLSHKFPLNSGFGGGVVRGLQNEQILIINIVNEYFTQQAF